LKISGFVGQVELPRPQAVILLCAHQNLTTKNVRTAEKNSSRRAATGNRRFAVPQTANVAAVPTTIDGIYGNDNCLLPSSQARMPGKVCSAVGKPARPAFIGPLASVRNRSPIVPVTLVCLPVTSFPACPATIAASPLFLWGLASACSCIYSRQQ
jgi:hypothetical protein